MMFGPAMRVTTSPAELRREIAALPRPLVLVPTMGALHAGHLALVRRAREIAGAGGTVAVSIFVNPIQFDRPGDLAAYPQPLEEDLAQCRAAGVDLAFTPAAGSMYFPDRSITVTEDLLSRHLCGAARPGHFDGVCTVVLKLFHLFQPEAAVFGEKDVQQLAILRRMVRALDVPVDILGHPTGRRLLKRDPMRLDLDAVLGAAASAGVAFEINCQVERLDLNDSHARLAKDRGVRLVVSTDAHSTMELGNLPWGVQMARRGWIGPEDVLNTRDVDGVRALLRRNRGH